MTLALFNQISGDSSALNALEGSTVYVTNNRGIIPSSSNTTQLHVIPTMNFTSEATLERAISQKLIPTGIKAILYDNEDWSQTPVDERLNPIEHYRLAANLAHANHYQFVATPGWIPGYHGIITPGMTVRPSAATILPAIASGADVVDIQAQKYTLESNLSAYLSWIEPIAKSIRAANPKAIIISGISTNPLGGTVDASQLAAIAKRSESIVQGWWLNVPTPSAKRTGAPLYALGEQFLSELTASHS